MSFRERSESAARGVYDTLAAAPSDEQAKAVVAIIEKAIIDAVVEANQRCTNVAMKCCSADRDIAHKIAEEIKREETALIANLSAMR